MKKKIFILCMALAWTASLMAQNISVVTPSGTTKLYRTLDEAIAFVNENADCVVYLPGGGHPISSNTNATIKKKVTIIGIGHKIKGENADGYTTISGNLYFYEGSDGSALLGCYVTGTVYIGNDNTAVNDVLIRYCNVNNITVKKGSETVVNQCYVRDDTQFCGNNGYFTHNIANRFFSLSNGFLEYNVITGQVGSSSNSIEKSSIIGNIFTGSNIYISSNCQLADNARTGGIIGNDGLNLGSNAAAVFVNPAGANSTSDYHFTEDYSQYQNVYGPYVGNQFNGTGLPPVPYIVAKQIPTETDASGMLNIKIRVKASE